MTVDKKQGKKKKNFTTSIDPEILYKFKVYCVVNKKNQNELVEGFMKKVIEGSENIGDTNK